MISCDHGVFKVLTLITLLEITSIAIECLQWNRQTHVQNLLEQRIYQKHITKSIKQETLTQVIISIAIMMINIPLYYTELFSKTRKYCSYVRTAAIGLRFTLL